MKPLFSVVIATYGRGALIEATLESVALQSEKNFEVLIVSDGPGAPGLADAVERFGSRFRLVETARRSRSQSEPNNAGWHEAQGRFIAYLGHDDLWLPTHLELLLATFGAHAGAAFAVSGCLFLSPPGSGDEHTRVTGMFDSQDTSIPLSHAFPPSALSHLREIPDVVPRWARPEDTGHPVDTYFVSGAVRSGMVFASTQTITVIKFASALRHLSYLAAEDWEQREVLALFEHPLKLQALVDERLAAAQDGGGYMTSLYTPEPTLQPGEQLELNEKVRGSAPSEMTRLDPSAPPLWISSGKEPRGTDWYGPEVAFGRDYRWSGPNPRPRLALPYFSELPVRIRLYVAYFAGESVRDSLRVSVNGESVGIQISDAATEDGFVLSFVASLRNDRPSVLEFSMSETILGTEYAPGSGDLRHLGFAYIGLQLTASTMPLRVPEETTIGNA